MKLEKAFHKWGVTTEEAFQIQEKICEAFTAKRLPLSKIRTVAGVDVSVRNGLATAATVVLNFPQLEELETAIAERPADFPYVPGLLSFREGPVVMESIKKLNIRPDVFIFDGQGTAHFRSAGLAVHMGVLIGTPSIGCAKKRLCGTYSPFEPRRGSSRPLERNKRVIGSALCTRNATKPVFVSPGHLCDITSAVEIVLACCPKYKVPQPIRLAHKACYTTAKRSADN